jgi:hypothetical protein
VSHEKSVYMLTDTPLRAGVAPSLDGRPHPRQGRIHHAVALEPAARRGEQAFDHTPRAPLPDTLTRVRTVYILLGGRHARGTAGPEPLPLCPETSLHRLHSALGKCIGYQHPPTIAIRVVWR